MILVCVCQFWIAHHRIFFYTSSRSNESFPLKERRFGKMSRKEATIPSRHSARSMLYGESPAFFASDNKLDFCSLFYTICIFASSRSSDIIEYLGVTPQIFFTEDNGDEPILLQKIYESLLGLSENDLIMLLPLINRLEHSENR